jgi:hypothetical protein
VTIRIRENFELVNRVRASLREHQPLAEKIRQFATERNLDEAQLHELVADSVINALDELGTAYSAEMTAVVKHMTRVRAEVNVVYERALSGAIDPSDPAMLRNLMSQLHDDMGQLADPETWARRRSEQHAAAPPASEPAVTGPPVSQPGTAEPAVGPSAGGAGTGGPAGEPEATEPAAAVPRRRLRDLTAAQRAQAEMIRRAAEAAAESVRMAPRNVDGLPPSWDYATYPYGPRGGWKPGISVDMPDGAGNYPSWDTIRKRVWRTKASDALAKRLAGAPTRADRLIALDPTGVLTDHELQDVARTGQMPERVGAEIEHKRIPQRMGRLLQEVGLDATDARELTKLGDASNLDPTVKEWHAVVDQRAREINPGRNPQLTISLDDRVEFPLGSATNEELAAIVGRLRERGIDLGGSEPGRRLREILQREKERRGAWAKWTVP